MFLAYMQHMAYALMEGGFKKGVDTLRKSRLYKDHVYLKPYVVLLFFSLGSGFQETAGNQHCEHK